MDFITEQDFGAHVANTINAYDDNLASCDIKAFNEHIVDPVNLIIDKSVYVFSWAEVIESEVFRQRDKSQSKQRSDLPDGASKIALSEAMIFGAKEQERSAFGVRFI